jgi:hypothetical protein
MGRYFGTRNLSRNFAVSMYSKGIPHSQEMWNVMAHRYRWGNNEFLMTACYDTCIIYKVSDGKYELIEDSNNQGGRELTQEEHDIEKERQELYKEKISCGIEHVIGNIENKIGSHYPDFDDLCVCKCCGYIFDSKDIESDKEKFDKIFFCS